jgi:hypothetical protein
MPILSQIHDCKLFSFLIDEQVVGISRGEYYADFAHWFQRHAWLLAGGLLNSSIKF